jgi:hypothetical protein
MTTLFMLALLSIFVCWLLLFRVRALELEFIQPFGYRYVWKFPRLRVFLEQRLNSRYDHSAQSFVSDSTGHAQQLRNDLAFCFGHVNESASARARRQGPAVPGLLREALTTREPETAA